MALVGTYTTVLTKNTSHLISLLADRANVILSFTGVKTTYAQTDWSKNVIKIGRSVSYEFGCKHCVTEYLFIRFISIKFLHVKLV